MQTTLPFHAWLLTEPSFVAGDVRTDFVDIHWRGPEARAEAAEVLRINPKTSLEGIGQYGWYNFQRADKERFINALREAGLK